MIFIKRMFLLWVKKLICSIFKNLSKSSKVLMERNKKISFFYWIGLVKRLKISINIQQLNFKGQKVNKARRFMRLESFRAPIERIILCRAAKSSDFPVLLEKLREFLVLHLESLALHLELLVLQL